MAVTEPSVGGFGVFGAPGATFGEPLPDDDEPTGPQEGDTRRDTYGTWTFQGGQWVLTTPVAPKEGDTRRGAGGEQWVYSEGQWVQPIVSPPVSPPTGGTQMPGTTPLTGEIGVATAGFGPFAQYMQRMGLGGGYQDPSQRYQRGLYDPMRSLYETQGVYGPWMGMERGPDWGGFMEQYAGQPMGVYNQYQNLLGGLFGMGAGERTTAGFGFEPSYDEFGGLISGNRPLSELQSLMTGGLTPQLGQRGAGWMASRLPQMQQNWSALQGGGGTFIDYIRQKYNLNQWL